ncbi:glycerophosphodiester phosphodiesterase [Paenibacillus albicereus]|uniref:Glycerophosphodiester phosphodiesterase n=1 Tax=Paenibacillus albicereus TaxID=2726185 RepID=A0A6H2GUJ0_9BACL|nr:glycerophosphodiester phosphodiesterase family protein [Paenibacillus albicereus]QJC51091.1 glycerophosphodiester phosphodiesterase [Paenibacillus albicereus]
MRQGNPIRRAVRPLLAAGWLGASLLLMSASPVADGQPELVAHRGASAYAPENTLAAFDEAVRLGADWIELDVRRTRDGQLAVIHDESAERVTGTAKRIGGTDLAELRQLDAGFSFRGGAQHRSDDSRASGAAAVQRIPLLDEVLERYAGRIGLLIELKDPALYPGIEAQVAERVKPFLGNRLLLQSFDLGSLERLRRLLPEARLGALIGEEAAAEFADGDWREQARSWDYVNVQTTLLDRRLVKLLHEEGALVMAWTVRSPEDRQRLASIGVDGLIMDDPRL